MKNEALRLADLLHNDPRSKAHHDEAAAELRRLSAGNDALLAALKLSRAQWIHSVNSDHCLAAIKQAEENT